MKLLVADADTRFTELIYQHMRQYDDMELIITHNGTDALHRIRSEHVDAVLMNMILPGVDGITMLRTIRSLKEPPLTICCSSFYSDVMLEAACVYGASFTLYKPLDPNSLHDLLTSCAEMYENVRKILQAVSSDDTSIQTQYAYIRNCLTGIGIPPKLIGCSYLAEAVRLVRSDAELLRNLSKGLYLEVARRMNTTPLCVERSMRSAINAAYRNGELRSRIPSCPSNREFISYVLQILPM